MIKPTCKICRQLSSDYSHLQSSPVDLVNDGNVGSLRRQSVITGFVF